jgi:hypothetical protein
MFYFLLSSQPQLRQQPGIMEKRLKIVGLSTGQASLL